MTERALIRIDDIQRLVAEAHGVALNEILSSSRSARIVRPRQIAMYLAMRMTTRTLVEIGDRFGGRDPTTIAHGVRQIEIAAAANEALAAEITAFEKELSR